MDKLTNYDKETFKKIESLLEREISMRKKLEEKLKITLDELINSNKENLLTLGIQISLLQKAQGRVEFFKDLFTHDISNILQMLMSGLEICEMNQNNPDRIEDIIKVIKSQVLRGAYLVSNIRKLSHIEESKISLIQMEICKILKNSIDHIKKSYQDKKINIIFINMISKQLYVQANELIGDLFNNILINAVTHNKSSVVEINVKISKEQKLDKNYLKIEFQDNGVGVEDSRKKKIFHRGYLESKSVHGIGLGLSLVKKIIDIYNGEIWVEDRVKGDHSRGSNFVLLIPEVN